MVAAVVAVRTTVVEGAVIAAEVISWRGLSSMDTKTNLPHSASHRMLVSTSVTSAESLKVAALNMITLPSTNGV